ncbi:hypothetical protein MVES1_003373 [Malassezia vespertilionis]|uniref:Ribophorin II C-terminal domain-containing protein n=1 Tax=Malassezia vespertilionis TaxID=2020962 RepID=A0A2N1J763_9BASI|nr:uncharacterized protein MVES1_003373 [Malassezia vespertilionis]PKI82397.1 hypothetical protein MVES_003614 [Malassezia vespertilionis]WFD08004.1 hypothetical protein MVES1_003373 [Malassezia vespertilionis]
MQLRRALGSALVLLCTVYAASYDITDARLSVSSFDGAVRLSKTYANKAQAAKDRAMVTMAPDDVVKLTFSVTSSDNGKKLDVERFPEQVFVALENLDSSAGQVHVWPLKMRTATVSSSWSVRVDRLPQHVKEMLANAGDAATYSVSLMLGGFAPSTKKELDADVITLMQLRFEQGMFAKYAHTRPSARALAEEAKGFHPWPARHHTFATEPWKTMPPAIVSLVIAIAIFCGPWFLLLSLWSSVMPGMNRLSWEGATLGTSIAALEVLAVVYWVGLSPFYVFPAASILAVFARISSKHAIQRAGPSP